MKALEVKTIIANQFGLVPDGISDDSTFSDLGADSLDAIELTFEAEERFGIEIRDDEIENVKTVRDFVRLVEGKV